MKITLGSIREILTEYNIKTTDEIIHQIRERFAECKYYKGTPEDLVIELYKERNAE